mmetsp:Transcript_53171/g.78922  ORF Transcript_53171/g.78922 Transcript_53171/m.78922 type:complete len:174 (+) Transcript_53171:146-667(+)|eukprot:CAMPEP_0195540950 /NCGR_PEP_ID=MMETSP0794_2-20130614/50834_1 /TAXON_ID=515487 /ORGANISM="Stephanopyxis turris, Strain CCMP 815" /LENGTH=173 /DNA_ID=CAMNT_0040675033 /DNA_START=144 /DNA_END=665 /DNA_ORIENTATION=+
MHTVWVRLNAVVFYGLTVLLGLSILAALSMYGHHNRHKPVVSRLKLKKLRSLKSHGGVDRALLSFDLHADLRPTFHWNIKQLFVYVVATYETKTNPSNQVVLWDKIVEAIHPEDMVIKEDNIFVKYALVDQGAELRGKEVQLKLMWDHMPLTGGLYMGESTNTSTFTLPIDYR